MDEQRPHCWSCPKLQQSQQVEPQQQLQKQEEKSLPQIDLYMQVEEMPLLRFSSLERERVEEEQEDRTAKKKEKVWVNLCIEGHGTCQELKPIRQGASLLLLGLR